MCPRCLLVMLLLLETRAWGDSSALEHPGCRDGETTVCLPEEPAAPEGEHSPREPCRGRACPRAAGEPCGVYTPSCARGLRCVPRSGEKTPLQSLLHGKGVCRKVGRGAGRNHTTFHPQPDTDGGRGSRPTLHPSAPHHLTTQVINSSQEVAPHLPANGDKEHLHHYPANGDTTQGSEVAAPCQLHLASVLQELRSSLFLNGKDMYIPNCDTRGFYRRKQCRSSKGQRRGQCWCVDKWGHPLPGSEGLEGNPHCPSGNN